MKKVLFALLLIISIAFVAGCGGGGGGGTSTTEPVVSSISLNKSWIQIPPGYPTSVRASVSNLDLSKIWWTATGGTFTVSQDKSEIYYTAGNTPGRYTITAGSYQDSTILKTVTVDIGDGVIRP